MRILQLAPLWEAVPPPAYGGTEAVVSLLADELARRTGLEVTLCASGDSRTTATLKSFYPRSLRTAYDIEDPAPCDWLHVALSLAEGRRYDLIHNHAGELAMAMSHLTDVPMLTTMHCAIVPDTKLVWDHYSGWYNTISHSQRATMPHISGGTFMGVVHNAIDVQSFPFSNGKDDYLLFLSRISADKGAHIAIEVARKLGIRLILAGKVDRVDRPYYEQSVRPLIDDKKIVFIGEADAHCKRELYRRARCLLLPLCWEEPFGLVMAEAMACGTPVVAFKRGAAPEIVEDGRTGFLVDTVDQMTAAVMRTDSIDPRACRKRVEDHFSPSTMVDRYVGLYEEILSSSRRERDGLRPLPRTPESHAALAAAGG